MESMPGFGNDDRAWGAAQGLGVYVAISRRKHALFVGCAAGKSDTGQSNFLLSNLFLCLWIKPAALKRAASTANARV
jgi:hypothetical protein